MGSVIVAARAYCRPREAGSVDVSFVIHRPAGGGCTALRVPKPQSGGHPGRWHGLHGLADPMVQACGPRLLMLDDDPNVREVVSALLTAIGYDCQTAAGGQAGLLRLEEGGWDLVLTDLTMSEVTGWDVVEAVRRRAPETRVVIITGLG